ncbi:hypothetical protein C0J52_25446 [Blattella germanica]|nr:hypothetical protein C0J52_25446 [Blattella germanica]
MKRVTGIMHSWRTLFLCQVIYYLEQLCGGEIEVGNARTTPTFPSWALNYIAFCYGAQEINATEIWGFTALFCSGNLKIYRMHFPAVETWETESLWCEGREASKELFCSRSSVSTL